MIEYAEKSQKRIVQEDVGMYEKEAKILFVLQELELNLIASAVVILSSPKL